MNQHYEPRSEWDEIEPPSDPIEALTQDREDWKITAQVNERAADMWQERAERAERDLAMLSFLLRDMARRASALRRGGAR